MNSEDFHKLFVKTPRGPINPKTVPLDRQRDSAASAFMEQEVDVDHVGTSIVAGASITTSTRSSEFGSSTGQSFSDRIARTLTCPLSITAKGPRHEDQGPN